jgi:hemerythrin
MSEKSCILVVEADAAAAEGLRAGLAERYEWQVAGSGAQARQMARDTPPNLILCSLQLPDADGYQLCSEFKADALTQRVPVLLLTSNGEARDEARGLQAGAADFVDRQLDHGLLAARMDTHMALRHANEALEAQNAVLESLVAVRTAELEANREELRQAMHNLRTTRVTTGVYWVQVPEAGLYILCGSPADVVKHLMLRGYIAQETRGGVECETGPNAILLSDVMMQNGGFANLAEFPVLQMLYRQGLILPGHPNNTGTKPLLIGSGAQVRAQLDYIYRGNYGLVNEEELCAAGLDEAEARRQMALKLRFAFGRIRATDDLLDYRIVEQEPVELANGVFVHRVGLNRFEFRYRGGSTVVDLSLAPEERYESPYTPGHHVVDRQYFGVIHSGNGDGWDLRRQSMGSIVMFQGRYYLVDAGPSILHTLRSLGIDVSEIEGIFHTHTHDDHFAGLPTLIASGHRIKYFATPLVRHSVTKKLAALMSMDEALFAEFFDVRDLKLDEWNDCDGMEVMPIFSPHPVENTVFVFRVSHDNGDRTYAHLADIVSSSVLTRMLDEMPEAERALLPDGYIESVQARYLTPATLKKIDAGGGLIHGDPFDFAQDTSSKVVFAHRATPYSREELEIGSEASFGAVDVLVPSSQDYLRQRAHRFLSQIFPEADNYRLNALVRSPVETYNAGSIILKRDVSTDDVYLLLTGTVEQSQADMDVPFSLATGSFLGAQALFESGPLTDTWRAASAVRLMRIGVATMRSFLMSGGWNDMLRTLLTEAAFLQRTWLFGEQVGFTTQSRLARERKLLLLSAGTPLEFLGGPCLYLVRQGELELRDKRGHLLETVGPGGFVGEESFLDRATAGRQCVARTDVEMLAMASPELRRIPIVLWKMLETHDRRQRAMELGGAKAKKRAA